MKIQIYRENELIQTLALVSGQTYVAGRKDSCDIRLDKSPGISREHFELLDNGTGIWQVKVLSKIMLIDFEGEQRDEFNLIDGSEFSLAPYRFVFLAEGNQTQMRPASHDHADNNMVGDLQQDNPQDLVAQDLDIESESNDEKTAIQSFSGVPYIKIIGQHGKKSEHFRLEGNLWLVGSDESSSIYIQDSSTSPTHFELSKTDKGFFITDLGSASGTFVNGQQLTANRPLKLLSGDIIIVGDSSLQFELRDHSFKKKINNIPLNMYKNPLVFFDQEVAIVALETPEESPGKVEEVSTDIFSDPQKRKKFIMMAVAGILVCAVIAKEVLLSANENDKKEMVGTDPFSQLSPAEQKIVLQTHKLAKQLYLAGNFELALVQLEKLHSIIPSYKDSKEMEDHCINSREIKRQQLAIEQQRREQEMLEQQVRSLLSQCYAQFKESDDVDGIRACLSPAMGLDPNNPGISQLISEVTARAEEKQIRMKMALEQEERARRGKELFEKAQLLYKKQNFHKAMEAYENHIHSGLPDPEDLIKTSKRNLASIEKKIRNERNQLMGQAQSQYGGARLKEAIELAEKAQIVDPYDPNISNFIHQAKKELTHKVRNIYVDSVIDENFGNFEASRIKWEEIIRIDTDDGEYFKKAKRKLRQYGYHP